MYNKKGFIENIEKNIFLKKYIKERKEYYNKVQLTASSIVGWKINEDEE